MDENTFQMISCKIVVRNILEKLSPLQKLFRATTLSSMWLIANQIAEGVEGYIVPRSIPR